ncbi:sulfotransferase family protein [Nocardioides donggukensis]|uniref:Sulfotransferase n=1 Tax=Nocardioides donggukensis TaxID=2774019 RepID=A0A927K507_9ACTN|nr:sulfotransferase [Nocardioides donggukensis]MBD8870867.1 sulfotransferase [Nocardioides donggukensis]
MAPSNDANDDTVGPDGHETPDASGDRIARRRRKRMELLDEVERHVPISFSLVGVQKAATSTLYRMLAKHPRVVGGPEKEMRFFMMEDRDWEHPDYSEYVRPARSERADMAGDATPEYFFWPGAMERMRRYNPDLRLMVSVRDPIERAMSQWSMQRDRDPDFPDVPDAIAAYASDRLPDRVPEGMPPFELRRQSLFTRGLYAQQLRRGYEHFDPSQWLVIDFRDLAARPHETLDRVTDHLGIPRFRKPPENQQRNITRNDHTGAAPSVDDVRRLVDLFADELRDFEELSGLDVSGWSTSRVLAGDQSVEDLTEQIARKLGLA